ncbi:MAG: hypothetical protein Nk1A_6520 [Endomicrobiia bacterium]|nr:MAG: hypothetical protein Nk1A_6520 [Endomicrobiia bacterium]
MRVSKNSRLKLISFVGFVPGGNKLVLVYLPAFFSFSIISFKQFDKVLNGL